MAERKKVFKWPLIIWGVISTFSLLYGGLYAEMYLEGAGYSLANIIEAGIGAVMIGFIPFILALIISYIYFNTKK
jgi:uncharacterized membrane protein YiaA